MLCIDQRRSIDHVLLGEGPLLTSEPDREGRGTKHRTVGRSCPAGLLGEPLLRGTGGRLREGLLLWPQ